MMKWLITILLLNPMLQAANVDEVSVHNLCPEVGSRESIVNFLSTMTTLKPEAQGDIPFVVGDKTWHITQESWLDLWASIQYAKGERLSKHSTKYYFIIDDKLTLTESKIVIEDDSTKKLQCTYSGESFGYRAGDQISFHVTTSVAFSDERFQKNAEQPSLTNTQHVEENHLKQSQHGHHFLLGATQHGGIDLSPLELHLLAGMDHL